MTILTSAPFDGQHIQPVPSKDDNKIAWWWTNIQADKGVNEKPPANIQIIFFQGHVFGRPTPDAPQFHASVDGIGPDGSYFFHSLSASSSSVVPMESESSKQRVVGTWEGVGWFISEPGVFFEITFNHPLVQGTIRLEGDGTPHHLASNFSDSLCFESVAPPEVNLSPQEEVLFKKLGWVVSIPAGRATVALKVEGKPLTFEGTGYHDQNFIDADATFGSVVSEWLFGTGKVGPYVFSYLETRAHRSEWTLAAGFLAKDGVILQNQTRSFRTDQKASVSGRPGSCSLIPWGAFKAPRSKVLMPQGYDVEYVLEHGQKFRFRLTAEAEVIDLSAYHRTIGNAVAQVGIEGGGYEGVVMFEWLNPGLIVYHPPDVASAEQ